MPAAPDGPPGASGSLSFDPVAHIYDETRGYPPEVERAIADAFQRRGPLPLGAHALEIGIGTGRIALPLLARGVHITGVDISERMMDRLRGKYTAAREAAPETRWGNLTLTAADMTALPFPDAAFDAVIGVHVLHLVPGWRQALAEALRVLRPAAPLLLGQDTTHGMSGPHVLQDEWVEIMRRLGYAPQRAGAESFSEVLREAQALGLGMEEWLVANWSVTTTIARSFADIATRSWSLTWGAPDDLFAESIRQLERQAHVRFGDGWNVAHTIQMSFRLARLTRKL